MIKNSFIFMILIAFIFLSAGCETTKGFMAGVGGTAQGLGKDTYNAFSFIKAADNWMQENLW